MRRILGTLLILPVLLLSACSGADDDSGPDTGTDTGTVVEDRGSSSPGTPSTAPAESGLDYDAELVFATAAGGETSPLLTPVSNDGDLEAFVRQFRAPAFPDDIRSAVESAIGAAGSGEVYAAIVSVGCDVPPGVEVTEGEAGYLVAPLKVKDPLPECLAAVTTVAVVTIR